MPEATYDYAIFGSTPFAAILAGSLGRMQGKRVLKIGAKASPQRLPRRLDLALPFASRPETWDLLLAGERETRSLLRAIGAPDALVPKDALVQADTDATRAFVGHLSHLVLAAGLRVTAKGAATTLRAVPFLRSDRTEDKIADWLAAAAIRSIDPHEVRMGFDDLGVATLTTPEGALKIGRIVVADDTALLDLPNNLRPDVLRVEELTSTLVAKGKPLATPVELFPDRGVSLLQRDDGSVLALVSGSAEIDARLASTFAAPFPIARLATGRTHHLVSADGAPVIGPLARSGLFIAAGLGDAATFFAPGLARYLAGVSSETETRWFAARDPAQPRQSVTEASP